MGFLFLELYSCTLYVVSQGPINQALRWEAVANGNQVIIKTHTTHTAWLFLMVLITVFVLESQPCLYWVLCLECLLF